MSKDTSAPAFPFQIVATSDCVGLLGENLEAGDNVTYTGMTMRQYAAIKAMQSLISENDRFKNKDHVEMMVQVAVQYADALLAELEK